MTSLKVKVSIALFRLLNPKYFILHQTALARRMQLKQASFSTARITTINKPEYMRVFQDAAADAFTPASIAKCL